MAGDRGLAEGRRGYATALCFARLFDELARCSRTALRKLRSRALRSCQIVTPATRPARSLQGRAGRRGEHRLGIGQKAQREDWER